MNSQEYRNFAIVAVVRRKLWWMSLVSLTS